MAELSLDNLFSGEEAEDFFSEGLQDDKPEEKETQNTEEKENKELTTEINPDSIFEDDKSESVGSEDNKDLEDTSSEKDGTSPNFFSSIAKALTEEGIFPDLDDDIISKVETPEDFRDLIDKQIQAGLDERLKRIDEALSVGIEPSEIKKFENTMDFLNGITDEALEDESELGERLRKNLIYQDFINRGYSQERANKEVQKSLKSGTDIEDARDSLEGNKEYFLQQYNSALKEAKQLEEQEKAERRQKAENLRNSILNDKKVFGEVEIDKRTRQRIYDNIAKPVYTDPLTGQQLTAIQKYERDNGIDFLKYVGFLYTMTDGFLNLDTLVKGKVNREVKKGMRELESKLNGTLRNSDGTLRLANGADDPESWLKNYSIDV